MLKTLNKLFIVWYNIFLKTKDGTPIFASVCMITISIQLWFFVPFALLKRLEIFNFLANNGIKVIYVLMYLICIIILYNYFKKNRIDDYLNLFKNETHQWKIIWIVIAITLLLCPLILIALILSW